MSKVTRLPPFSKTAHMEADIPVSPRDEFDQAMIGFIAGERPRMEAVERRALSALQMPARKLP